MAKTTNGIKTSNGYHKSVPFADNATHATSADNATHATSADNATNATKVNNLEITQDENGVLKIGDIIIPQKKLLWSGAVTVSSSNVIELPSDMEYGKVLEIHTNDGYIFTFKATYQKTATFATGAEKDDQGEANVYSVAKLTAGVTSDTWVLLVDVFGSTGITITSIYEIIE